MSRFLCDKVNGEAREGTLGYKVNGEAREGTLGCKVIEVGAFKYFNAIILVYS
ncbi:MAG: hypothetical protein Q9M17_09810 [Mariprofundus sp.]|nr:hypothetical protein [Mariprofundus sp.]